MGKLSNTKAELKKNVAYKKKACIILKNKTKFSDCVDKYGHAESADYWVMLTMTKTGYNIRNSKCDLRLHSFREVWLGNKQLSGSNKLTL